MRHYKEHGEKEYNNGKKNGDTKWPGGAVLRTSFDDVERDVYKGWKDMGIKTKNPILAGIMWLAAALAEAD